MGIGADSVGQVIEPEPSDVLASSAFGTAGRANSLLGLGRQGERSVLLLDPGRVLSAAELMQR